VALVAPYGEQSRVTLRAEAEKAKRPDVARAFGEANTVAWLFNKARFSPDFRESLQGADIYVDEASLLDNQTMLGLVNLAREVDARVIFQGDTKQLEVYERTTLERGPSEVLLLTQKIKADGKTYENGSRQTIVAIDRERIRFESELELHLDDGRVRQGDAVTTYKAQGASKTEMIRVEDNRSLLAMANREDLHVAFTRHREQARMFVQDIDLLRQVANRSLIKDVMARDLETRKTTSFVERMEALLTRAMEVAKSMATKAARREQQRLRELAERKKRQEKIRAYARRQNRGQEMAV
jgi:AAA domain